MAKDQSATRPEVTGFHGESRAIKRLCSELHAFAATNIGVLLCGETGVGKEVAARSLHRLSGRRGPFVPVNVAALPDALLEGELFGALKGAFTGASRTRRGLVDMADGGTLFLDEIGELSPQLQVNLLRFLETKEVRPLGSDSRHRVDVRVVSATHMDLDRQVAKGTFRRDLYYRIAGVSITVPPLRERRDDINRLRSIFETEAAVQHGLEACQWSPEAETILENHPWPGNVRELKHAVEVAMVRAAGKEVLPKHLPFNRVERAPGGRWDQALVEFRRRFLSAALRRNAGNRSATARELGISRQALLYHIRNLGL
jgi:sigma-54-dependent transcriptional regulator